MKNKIIQFEKAKDSLETAFSSFNEVLDSEQKYSNIDILRHIDDDHIIKRFSLYISAATYLPKNTVFLMTLGTFSSMSARKYCVLYKNGKPLPIGIYAVAEQPPATSKTRCLNFTQDPFRDIYDRIKHKTLEDIERLERKKEPDEHEISDLEDRKALLKRMGKSLFVTNSTPEALDSILNSTGGFFSAVSSEQGLFNSLLGISYNSAGGNNNDALLNGFDGQYTESSRLSRDTFSGRPVGAIVCFAQDGTIEKVLNASNGTGVSERFLMIAERHALGTRNHLLEPEIDIELEHEFQSKCEFIENILLSPRSARDLSQLTISEEGHRMIAEYRNRIEAGLADGGKYSHISLRGAAGKINMQIMKIAANLQILDDTCSNQISDKYIQSAINIADDLLEENLRLCREKGIIGLKAEFSAILNYLSNKNGFRTEQEIINSLKSTKPFKDCTANKAAAIRAALAEMVSQSLISAELVGGKASYSR
jgi:hypothetical protein